MDHFFPEAKFEIRIRDNEVLSPKSLMFLKLDYKCPCYDVRPPQNAEYIRVSKPKGPILISDAIQAMIDYDVNPDCKHYFLTGFIKNTEVQFTVVFDL